MASFRLSTGPENPSPCLASRMNRNASSQPPSDGHPQPGRLVLGIGLLSIHKAETQNQPFRVLQIDGLKLGVTRGSHL